MKEAIINTFNSRESLEYLNDYEQIINSIFDDEKIHKLWNIYSKKYDYAEDISIDDILILLKKEIKKCK